jgi:hypothetical protein
MHMALVPITVACLTAAAAAYGFPTAVRDNPLIPLLVHEAGKVGACTPNKPPAKPDCGPLQINEWWWPYFARRWQLPGGPAEAKQLITNNGCVNAYAGAEILRLEYDAANGDLRQALAQYHSRDKRRQEIYLAKLASAYLRVFPTG